MDTGSSFSFSLYTFFSLVHGTMTQRHLAFNRQAWLRNVKTLCYGDCGLCSDNILVQAENVPARISVI